VCEGYHITGTYLPAEVDTSLALGKRVIKMKSPAKAVGGWQSNGLWLWAT